MTISDKCYPPTTRLLSSYHQHNQVSHRRPASARSSVNEFQLSPSHPWGGYFILAKSRTSDKFVVTRTDGRGGPSDRRQRQLVAIQLVSVQNRYERGEPGGLKAKAHKNYPRTPRAVNLHNRAHEHELLNLEGDKTTTGACVGAGVGGGPTSKGSFFTSASVVSFSDWDGFVLSETGIHTGDAVF